MKHSASLGVVCCGLGMVFSACTAAVSSHAPAEHGSAPPAVAGPAGPHRDGRHGAVTLAFAGDVHFQIQLAGLLDHPGAGLGEVDRVLSGADLAMVNLESAITERGTLEAKELEQPDDRYWYRTSPAALDLLAHAGVDVVTVANNHGADYGPQGVSDTLRAARQAPVAVVGIGADRTEAFTPYRVTVKGTRLAVLGADASFREGASSVWSAGPRSPGLAGAHEPRPRDLLAAVRTASRTADVVVVYLHWGEALRGCPTSMQVTTARALSAAGADVVVGSHAHVLLGSGWLGDTYVNYGLGNFVWYHDHQPDSGVLRIRVRDGGVVADDWVPARIPPGGGAAVPLPARARHRAVEEWRSLRACAGLHGPAGTGAGQPYRATIRTIGPRLRDRMRSSHGAGCPLPWHGLRRLRMSYVGFDGRSHSGEMVVAAAYARDVVGVFRKLYAARWPIRRMRTVDAYAGDDDRSMAANNTSGYNCRPVAGSDDWSDHAYGAAIDIDPVQNPYLRDRTVAPAGGSRFAALDRTAGASVPAGVITADDVVVRAFESIGWEWGGTWSSPDYQHFAARH